MRHDCQQDRIVKSKLDEVEKTFLRWSSMKKIELEVEKYRKDR
ncbi:hypothetical protein [Alkalihalobacterium bogoriense]|nr:hypothetical protein [Alkalihalobacterium bogoriense]